jgi:hypothetical protein
MKAKIIGVERSNTPVWPQPPSEKGKKRKMYPYPSATFAATA